MPTQEQPQGPADTQKFELRNHFPKQGEITDQLNTTTTCHYCWWLGSVKNEELILSHQGHGDHEEAGVTSHKSVRNWDKTPRLEG